MDDGILYGDSIDWENFDWENIYSDDLTKVKYETKYGEKISLENTNLKYTRHRFTIKTKDQNFSETLCEFDCSSNSVTITGTPPQSKERKNQEQMTTLIQFGTCTTDSFEEQLFQLVKLKRFAQTVHTYQLFFERKNDYLFYEMMLHIYHNAPNDAKTGASTAEWRNKILHSKTIENISKQKTGTNTIEKCYEMIKDIYNNKTKNEVQKYRDYQNKFFALEDVLLASYLKYEELRQNIAKFDLKKN